MSTYHGSPSRARFSGVFHELPYAFVGTLVVSQPYGLPFSNAFTLFGDEVTSFWLAYPFKLTN